MKMRIYRNLVVLMMLALCGCGNEPQTRTSLPTEIAFTHTPLPAAATSEPTATPTPAFETVTVAAVQGNLFIRRGPDLAYNAVSVLLDGQRSRAVARDVLGGWLQVFLPGNSRETGWVSIQSRYSEVDGDVMSLPAVMPTDWPAQAWLRNCTHHQMQVNPGGILIAAVDHFPDNEVLLNPGVYTVHDIEVDRAPEVMELEIKEGSEMDILDDGTGDHRKCPSS